LNNTREHTWLISQAFFLPLFERAGPFRTSYFVDGPLVYEGTTNEIPIEEGKKNADAPDQPITGRRFRSSPKRKGWLRDAAALKPAQVLLCVAYFNVAGADPAGR